MSKTVPGPKELAQRAMQEARVERGKKPPWKKKVPYAGKNYVAAGPPPPKKRGLIPYAGKPRMGADHGIFGVKPGPKLKPGRPRKIKP